MVKEFRSEKDIALINFLFFWDTVLKKIKPNPMKKIAIV
jgi:hypothetical protein